jgi:hypothetical protein
MSKLDNPVFDEEDLCIESLAGKASDIAKATCALEIILDQVAAEFERPHPGLPLKATSVGVALFHLVDDIRLRSGYLDLLANEMMRRKHAGMKDDDDADTA